MRGGPLQGPFPCWRNPGIPGRREERGSALPGLGPFPPRVTPLTGSCAAVAPPRAGPALSLPVPNSPRSASGRVYAEDGGREPQAGSPRPPGAHRPASPAPGGTAGGADPRPPRKVHGMIFESARNSGAAAARVSFIIPPASAVREGRRCASAAAAAGGRVFGEGDDCRRLPVAGGWGAAAARAREEERRRRRRRRQFPLSPALARRAHAHLCPQPWTIFVRTTRETEKEREFGGVRSGGFRSDPQAV